MNLRLTTLLLICALPSLSFEAKNLINRPIPLLPNKTLDGKAIDAQYFQGHVTLVNFMYIGCPPCMAEIHILNKIREDYLNNEAVQILCVARQMRGQMADFNSSNKTLFSTLRKAFGADSIQYAIQPACKDAFSKMDTANNNIHLKSECSTIEDVYGVSGYPTMMYVDRKGIIRKIDVGGPTRKDDTAFYLSVRSAIDQLLAGKDY